MIKKNLGFTLIELLVSISIIAVLSAIGVVSYTNANREARNNRRRADLEQVRSALEIFRADEGDYPDYDPPPTNFKYTNMGLVLENGGYINTMSVDPKGGSFVYTYSNLTSGSAGDFQVCATLEPSTAYCVYNP